MAWQEISMGIAWTARAFRDLWARVVFGKLSNHHEFFVYYILNKITPKRYFVRLRCTLLETLFNGFKNAHMF